MKMPHFINKHISVVCLVLFLHGALTGCISTSAPTKETFLLDASPMPPLAKTASGHVLAVRKLQIATSYEGRSFVYRTGESSYVRDPYAEFLDWPADELIVSIRKQLRHSGVFAAVAEPSSAIPPTTFLEVTVGELYGDLRQKDHSQAVLTLRFVFLEGLNGRGEKVIFQKEYSRRLPMKETSASALIESWNQALGEILTEAALDFTSIASIENT